LKKGWLKSPKNFKDRLMLTDVGEAFFDALRSRKGRSEFGLRWVRDYYPWSISVDLDGLLLSLESEVIGGSNWQSVIIISPQSPGKDQSLHRLMRAFSTRLGRDPLDTPYLSELEFMELFERKGMALVEMKESWETISRKTTPVRRTRRTLRT